MLEEYCYFRSMPVPDIFVWSFFLQKQAEASMLNNELELSGIQCGTSEG